MPYNNFTVEEVGEKFNLVFKAKSFVPGLEVVFPSSWLKETLLKTLPLTKWSDLRKLDRSLLLLHFL
jgi:hypothetical protein